MWCNSKKIFLAIIVNLCKFWHWLLDVTICTMWCLLKIYSFMFSASHSGPSVSFTYWNIYPINDYSRSPSTSRIRAKMLYSTSKDRIKHELDGFHYEIQATDPSEVDIEVLRERAHWSWFTYEGTCGGPWNFSQIQILYSKMLLPWYLLISSCKHMI